MANVLQGLGYRVHPPSEENGPLFAFSMKPRFVREREEQRERERLQQRQQREQRRRERPDGRTSGSSLLTFRAPREARTIGVATARAKRDHARKAPRTRGRRTRVLAPRVTGHATIAAGRGRRAVTAAGRRFGLTPPPRKRATRQPPTRRSPSCSSSSSAERSPPGEAVAARCGSTSGCGTPASSIPDPGRTLCRKIALSHRRPRRRQAPRNGDAGHGVDLCAGTARAGGAHRCLGRAARAGDRGPSVV